MRLIVDSLIAMLLVGLLVVVLRYHQQQRAELASLQDVHHALADLQEQSHYHRALDAADRDAPLFPRRVSPLWFDGRVPLNALAPGRQPWIDLAPEGDRGEHPPDPVVDQPTQAGFWYNPARGVFRARVPRRMTDAATLDLYNRANGCELRAMPFDRDPARRPVPMPFPDGGPDAPASP